MYSQNLYGKRMSCVCLFLAYFVHALMQKVTASKIVAIATCTVGPA